MNNFSLHSPIPTDFTGNLVLRLLPDADASVVLWRVVCAKMEGIFHIRLASGVFRIRSGSISHQGRIFDIRCRIFHIRSRVFRISDMPFHIKDSPHQGYLTSGIFNILTSGVEVVYVLVHTRAPTCSSTCLLLGVHPGNNSPLDNWSRSILRQEQDLLRQGQI